MTSSATRRIPSGPECKWASAYEGRAPGGLVLWIVGADSAETGYDIARPLRGQSLATEAAAAVIAFGFGEFGLGDPRLAMRGSREVTTASDALSRRPSGSPTQAGRPRGSRLRQAQARLTDGRGIGRVTENGTLR